MDGRYPVRVLGPLAPLVHTFRAELVGRGFTPRSAQDNAYVLAHLSRWLEHEGLVPVELTTERLNGFVQARRAIGYRRWVTARSLRLLLSYLREVHAIPPEELVQVECPVERLVNRYRDYLRCERRLAECTVRLRVDLAREFLLAQLTDGHLRLDQLEPASVIGFVTQVSRRYATGSMKTVTSALRSLLRYLFVTAKVDRDLAPAVPSVAGWRLSTLPSAAGLDALPTLLGSCDQNTAVGRRDFAVLLLMARLGLRAKEIAALRLEDVDWRNGELVVHGKGGRIDRLPLPCDVGSALANYLQRGRRASRHREVFLRTCGPDTPMARQSVVMVPRCASHRAGVPTVSAHQLRHRAACQVLAAGGSLAEVAQLLRHDSQDTSAIYAKVDMAALASVVRAWPETSER